MPDNFDSNIREQQPNQFSQQETFQNQQRWGWPCPPCPPCRCDCRQCWGWNRPWDGQWDGRGQGQGQGQGQRPGQGNQPPRR